MRTCLRGFENLFLVRFRFCYVLHWLERHQVKSGFEVFRSVLFALMHACLMI